MTRTTLPLAGTVASGVPLISSSAFAQSNVSLSGAVDLGIEKPASGQAAKMSSGRSTNSFFRFSGSEDLGGGLKANFFLQHVFDATNGTGPGTFNDGANVGLSGNFGGLTLGRSLHPTFLQALALTTMPFRRASRSGWLNQ